MSVVAEIDRPLLARFADVLDYPDEELGAAIEDCRRLLAEDDEGAAKLLATLAALVAERPLGEVQELYTAAFDLDTLSDLNATCYPYVGHHLFGESHKRSKFLVGLIERFRTHDFTPGCEMPDHLVVLLRFSAMCPDDELVGELLVDGIVPALERMAGDIEPSDEPASGRAVYLRALAALRLALVARLRQPMTTGPIGAV